MCFRDLLRYIKDNNLKALPPPSVAAPATAAKPSAPAPTPAPPKTPAKAPTPQLTVDLPDYEDIPLTSMRNVIAKRLTESKVLCSYSTYNIGSKLIDSCKILVQNTCF